MGFSNTTMRVPVSGLPHIAYIDGWWRVSPAPKHNVSPEQRARWNSAHAYVREMHRNREEENANKE